MVRFYFYHLLSPFLEPFVREVIGDDEHFIALLAANNHDTIIFFTSTDPIETNAEPLVINKIA